MSKSIAERIEALLGCVQEDGRLLPWTVQSGCSYRRIATLPTRENGARGSNGNVLAPHRQASDGHPDLTMPEWQLEALCELVNMLPEVAAALRAQEATNG